MSNLGKINNELEQAIQSVAGAAGRAYLHSLYPNEFEYYMLVLELYDFYTDELEDSLIFPVMPNAISESEVLLTNIKKTMSSVNIIKNVSYAPRVISIQGTFGKKIRILLSKNTNATPATGFTTKVSKEANATVKTGYGVIKILERIIKASKKEGSLLFLHNLSLGTSYLIETTDFSFNQSLENNMMWNYQLNIKTIAESNNVYVGGQKALKSSINELLKLHVITKGINMLADKATQFINNKI